MQINVDVKIGEVQGRGRSWWTGRDLQAESYMLVQPLAVGNARRYPIPSRGLESIRSLGEPVSYTF